MRSGRDPVRTVTSRSVSCARPPTGAASSNPGNDLARRAGPRRPFEKIGPEERDPTLLALCDVARDRGIVVQVGSIPVLVGDKVANRAFVIGAGGDSGLLRQDPPFDVDLPSGEKMARVRHLHGRRPGGPRRNSVGPDRGHDLLRRAFSSPLPHACRERRLVSLAPACFTKQTGEAHWHVLQRARAIETGSFMLSAAQGGQHEDGRETFGHSIIVDPWGRVLAEAGTEPGVILAEIDTRLVADALAHSDAEACPPVPHRNDQRQTASRRSVTRFLRRRPIRRKAPPGRRIGYSPLAES